MDDYTKNMLQSLLQMQAMQIDELSKMVAELKELRHAVSAVQYDTCTMAYALNPDADS